MTGYCLSSPTLITKCLDTSLATATVNRVSYLYVSQKATMVTRLSSYDVK